MVVADITDWKSPRGRVAALSRSRLADDPDLINARRDLRAARLADYVKRSVESAPPLTAAQRACIAALLGPATTAGGGRVAR